MNSGRFSSKPARGRYSTLGDVTWAITPAASALMSSAIWNQLMRQSHYQWMWTDIKKGLSQFSNNTNTGCLNSKEKKHLNFSSLCAPECWHIYPSDALTIINPMHDATLTTLYIDINFVFCGHVLRASSFLHYVPLNGGTFILGW